MTPDVEAALGKATAARALVVGPLLVVAIGLVRGWPGAVAAAVGVGIVAANFVLAGVVLSWAYRRSPSFYHAVALAGFIIRLGLITLVMFGVAWLWDVDRPAMAVAVVASYLVLLAWEAIVVSRRRRGR
ncbi:MAG: hypothetical protein JW785_03650 [Acidimicrobiia bacterium]|nr:hypothetical protein [Acidimicrobiia bacterium]